MGEYRKLDISVVGSGENKAIATDGEDIHEWVLKNFEAGEKAVLISQRSHKFCVGAVEQLDALKSEVIADETCEALREPVLALTKTEIERLEEFLGVELIYGERESHPGKFCISRLALANAFINDVRMGLRIAIDVDSETNKAFGCRFIDCSDMYSEEDKVRFEELSTRPVNRLYELVKDLELTDALPKDK